MPQAVWPACAHVRLLYPALYRVRAACAYCSWQFEAGVDEAHAAFEAHMCERPKPKKRKRRVAA